MVVFLFFVLFCFFCAVSFGVVCYTTVGKPEKHDSVLENKSLAKGCLPFLACFDSFGLSLVCQCQAVLKRDNSNE